jgi:hypothetical protein
VPIAQITRNENVILNPDEVGMKNPTLTALQHPSAASHASQMGFFVRRLADSE